jgi:hypothetical protein
VGIQQGYDPFCNGVGFDGSLIPHLDIACVGAFKVGDPGRHTKLEEVGHTGPPIQLDGGKVA